MDPQQHCFFLQWEGGRGCYGRMKGGSWRELGESRVLVATKRCPEQNEMPGTKGAILTPQFEGGYSNPYRYILCIYKYIYIRIITDRT